MQASRTLLRFSSAVSAAVAPAQVGACRIPPTKSRLHGIASHTKMWVGLFRGYEYVFVGWLPKGRQRENHHCLSHVHAAWSLPMYLQRLRKPRHAKPAELRVYDHAQSALLATTKTGGDWIVATWTSFHHPVRYVADKSQAQIRQRALCLTSSARPLSTGQASLQKIQATGEKHSAAALSMWACNHLMRRG